MRPARFGEREAPAGGDARASSRPPRRDPARSRAVDRTGVRRRRARRSTASPTKGRRADHLRPPAQIESSSCCRRSTSTVCRYVSRSPVSCPRSPRSGGAVRAHTGCCGDRPRCTCCHGGARAGHPVINQLSASSATHRPRQVRQDLTRATRGAALRRGNLVRILIGLADPGRQQPSRPTAHRGVPRGRRGSAADRRRGHVVTNPRSVSCRSPPVPAATRSRSTTPSPRARRPVPATRQGLLGGVAARGRSSRCRRPGDVLLEPRDAVDLGATRSVPAAVDIYIDPPEHREVSQAQCGRRFSPGRLRALGRLDAATPHAPPARRLQRRPRDVEFVADFSVQLPIPGDRRDAPACRLTSKQFREWSDACRAASEASPESMEQ